MPVILVSFVRGLVVTSDFILSGIGMPSVCFVLNGLTFFISVISAIDVLRVFADARVQQRVVEQMSDLPVPVIVKKVIEMPRVITDAHAQQRGVEHFVAFQSDGQRKGDRGVEGHRRRAHTAARRRADREASNSSGRRKDDRNAESHHPYARTAAGGRSFRGPPVPVVVEKVIEAPRVIIDARARQPVVERLVWFPVRRARVIAGSMRAVSRDTVQQRTVEQTVDLPVPTVVEKVIETPRVIAATIVQQHGSEGENGCPSIAAGTCAECGDVALCAAAVCTDLNCDGGLPQRART